MSKLPKKIVLGTLLLLACARFISSEAMASEILWKTSVRQAKQTAAQSGRPLLIYVGADFCGFCRKMERFTWANDSVSTSVAAGFVPLKIDSQRSPQLTQQLRVQALPSIILLSPTGQMINRVDGYMDAVEMLRFLRQATSSTAVNAATSR